MCTAAAWPFAERDLAQIYERIIDVMRSIQKNEIIPGSEQTAHKNRRIRIQELRPMIVAMHDSASEDQSSRSSINWFTSALRFTAPRERAKPCSAASVSRTIRHREIEMLPGVQEATASPRPTAAGRNFRPEGTIVSLPTGSKSAQQDRRHAGPCSVESREQLFAVTELIAKAGPHSSRRAFKPRSSPYSFQGSAMRA